MKVDESQLDPPLVTKCTKMYLTELNPGPTIRILALPAEGRLWPSYIKLLQKMRDLGQDDIRQIKQCLELCHIIFSICEVQKRLIVENDNEELSSKWSDIRI